MCSAPTWCDISTSVHFYLGHMRSVVSPYHACHWSRQWRGNWNIRCLSSAGFGNFTSDTFIHTQYRSPDLVSRSRASQNVTRDWQVYTYVLYRHLVPARVKLTIRWWCIQKKIDRKEITFRYVFWIYSLVSNPLSVKFLTISTLLRLSRKWLFFAYTFKSK